MPLHLQEEKRSLLVKLRQAASSSDQAASDAQTQHASSQSNKAIADQAHQQQPSAADMGTADSAPVRSKSDGDAQGVKDLLASRQHSGTGRQQFIYLSVRWCVCVTGSNEGGGASGV